MHHGEKYKLDMDKDGATLKNGQEKHTSRESKLMNLLGCI
jgi:hypothetical protein